MKKRMLFCLACFVCALTLTGAAHAKAREITVTLPDYRVEVNECDVYYWDSVYPFLSYKDVTYFPMTYDYCRTLGLTTSWVDGDGFYVAYTAGYGQVPVYETTVNKKENTAVLPSYKIYVNGKEYDNSGAEYPLFNFRGVTYFPMTWDFAHEEFCWGTEWTGDLFHIRRNSAAWNDLSSHSLLFMRMEENGILLRHDYIFPIVQADGGESYTSVTKYEKYLYATDTGVDVTGLDEEKPGDGETVVRIFEGEADCKIENGKVYLEGQELPEVVIPTEEELKTKYPQEYGEVTFGVSAAKVTLGNVTFYHVTGRVDYHIWFSDTQYTYAQAGGRFVYLGTNVEPFNAAKLGEVQYFGLHAFAKTTLRHYQDNEILTRVDPDGKVTVVNDLFPDYGNMKLIGEAGGKLYLKCTWSPVGTSEMQSPAYLVSAANDGYFTYDGESLQKIARYRYTDTDILSPDGHVYAVIHWKPEFIKIV